MTDAAFTGEFSDFKLVKTRSTAQIIIELPIEQADAALKALGGLPKPGSAVHVAVARVRMKNDPLPVEKPKGKWEDLSLAQRAGIRCCDPAFQDWFSAKVGFHGFSPTRSAESRRDWVANGLKQLLKISSRSEITAGTEVGLQWLALDEEYRQSQGLLAERTT